MLDNCKDNRERWRGVETLLQVWLKERRELLVKYTAIAATLDRREARDIDSGLRRLRQLLVDYVSAGHFEIYSQLVREAEAFADGTGETAARIIPSIGDTTEVILGFDEKYSNPECRGAELEDDLSLLGEMLESRFELEDRLIAVLHRSHAGA